MKSKQAAFFVTKDGEAVAVFTEAALVTQFALGLLYDCGAFKFFLQIFLVVLGLFEIDVVVPFNALEMHPIILSVESGFFDNSR